MSNDMTAGTNPQYGASINYWLGATPQGPVRLRISNAAGTVVRTLQGTASRGINRVTWNLEDNASMAIRLRTTPLYADWVDMGAQRVRQVNNGMTIRQAPGTYTVTLEVDGQTYTQPLTVLKDPNSEGTEAEIAAQVAMVQQIRVDHDSAASAINRIEWTRRQLEDLRAILRDQPGSIELLQMTAALNTKLVAIEEGLIQLRVTGTGQDGVRYPTQVSEQLRYVAGNLTAADFKPTAQDSEVHILLKSKLEASRKALEAVLATDLQALNRLLQQRNLPGIIMEDLER